MYTSYFAKNGGHPNAVSIAAKAPDWFPGRVYKQLAPTYHAFKEYKETGDSQKYTDRYFREVLNTLDPRKVYSDLGRDAILLCYEKPNVFCHRHLVAGWLMSALKIHIMELLPDSGGDN
jgi:hypothetical protein